MIDPVLFFVGTFLVVASVSATLFVVGVLVMLFAKQVLPALYQAREDWASYRRRMQFCKDVEQQER